MKQDSNIFFNEEQRLKHAWIWLVLALMSFLIFSYGLFVQMILHKPWGNKPMDDKGLIIVSILVTSIFIVVYFVFKGTRLITEIKSEGIYLKYPPYFTKHIVYHFNDIKHFNKHKYSALKDYGGNGVRKKPKNNEVAYLVFGDEGIQLALSSGQKVLIGTQRSEYFLSAIRKAMRGMV